jgi:hypothetical protein
MGTSRPTSRLVCRARRPAKFQRRRLTNLPHQERVLSPFFVSRNIGVKLSHVFGEKQFMTASLGVYND